MNDETKDELMKRTREWLQSCVNAATRSGEPEEADLEAFILAHIDGEPARLAAKAEEVREACALRAGAGDPEDHDHAKPWPCWWCAKANEVREVPLTATPLGDEVRALRARVAELEAQAAKDDTHVVEVNDAHLKTVAALRGRAEKAERLADQLCAVLGREVGNRGDSEGAVDVAERLIRERDEAVAALRRLVGASAMLLGRFQRLHDSDVLREVNEQPTDDALEQARAVLAKYPEER